MEELLPFNQRPALLDLRACRSARPGGNRVCCFDPRQKAYRAAGCYSPRGDLRGGAGCGPGSPDGRRARALCGAGGTCYRGLRPGFSASARPRSVGPDPRLFVPGCPSLPALGSRCRARAFGVLRRLPAGGRPRPCCLTAARFGVGPEHGRLRESDVLLRRRGPSRDSFKAEAAGAETVKARSSASALRGFCWRARCRAKRRTAKAPDNGGPCHSAGDPL